MIEKVNPCHPDKIADRIAGAIVDLAYEKEENPKIAVEVLIGHDNCHIIAETNVALDYDTIKEIVYRIAGHMYVNLSVVKFGQAKDGVYEVDGLTGATELITNTDLATAENSTAAAATAVVDAEGKLTIHLFADAKVYTFTQKEQGPATAIDNNTAVAPQVDKILRNGQVLIIRDGKTFNMMGQEVIRQDVNVGGSRMSINVSDLTDGVYFYSLIVNNQTVKTNKLVVSK